MSFHTAIYILKGRLRITDFFVFIFLVLGVVLLFLFVFRQTEIEIQSEGLIPPLCPLLLYNGNTISRGRRSSKQRIFFVGGSITVLCRLKSRL